MQQGKLHKYQFFLMMTATGLAGIITYEMLRGQIGSGAWLAALISAAASALLAGLASALLHGRRIWRAASPVFLALGILIIVLYAGGRSFWEMLPVIAPAVYTALKGERVTGRAATIICIVVLLIYAVVLCVTAGYAKWSAILPFAIVPEGTLLPSIIKAVLLNFAFLLPTAMHSSCLEDRRGATWLTIGGAALGLGVIALSAVGSAVTVGQDYSIVRAGYVRAGLDVPFTLAGALSLGGEIARYFAVTIAVSSAFTMAYRVARKG